MTDVLYVRPVLTSFVARHSQVTKTFSTRCAQMSVGVFDAMVCQSEAAHAVSRLSFPDRLCTPCGTLG